MLTKDLGARALAVVSACVVLFGVHAKSATWPAACGLALILGLGVLLSIPYRTSVAPAEVGADS
jgi:hypothetical protein